MRWMIQLSYTDEQKASGHTKPHPPIYVDDETGHIPYGYGADPTDASAEGMPWTILGFAEPGVPFVVAIDIHDLAFFGDLVVGMHVVYENVDGETYTRTVPVSSLVGSQGPQDGAIDEPGT